MRARLVRRDLDSAPRRRPFDMPIVLIPAPYRGPTKGKAEIDVEPGSVLECIDRVEAQCPGFKELVVDPQGNVQRFAKLFLNEEALDAGDPLSVAVSEGDRLEVLAAVAGG
jgi:molybdopterin converting factor small subunit